MIAADVLRGVVVLGLLLIRRPDQVWIAYVVTAVMVSASAFFEPARTATIPNITSADELLPANALSSALWSGMLAIGASIGGLATVVAGRNAAFVLNARVVLRLRHLHRADPVRRDAAGRSPGRRD